jgi:predicted nucleic acid-binding protein
LKILVDSSVWIDYFNNNQTPQVEVLEGLLGIAPILIGDLILTEVLQGVRNQREYKRISSAFDGFEHIDLAGREIAVKAALNYRLLREKGVTVRKTIDTIIATKCIEEGISLLHDDSDFPPFAQHLGLKMVFLPA